MPPPTSYSSSASPSPPEHGFSSSCRRALAVLFACLLPGLGAAADAPAQAEVRVQPAVLMPGQAALLEIELPEQGVTRLPEMPVVEGARVEAQRAGRTRRGDEIRVVSTGVFTPSRTGIITIMPVTIPRNGLPPLVTRPVDVTVLAEADAGTPPPPNRKLHTLLLTPKNTFFSGEQFPLQVLVLVDPSAHLQDLDQPKLPRDGFAIDRFENPVRGEMTFGGKRWLTFAYSARCTPTATGQLPLGPVEVNASILVADDESNNPFQRFRQFKLPAKSETRNLTIRKFPDGAPDGFDGTVGSFTLEAAFDPAPARAEDPVAVRLTVRGTGDPAQVSLPALTDESGWEQFEGSREEQARNSSSLDCEASFRRILRPRGAAATEVPPFSLVFFNPKSGKYESARSQPLRLPLALAAAPAGLAGPGPGTGLPATGSPAASGIPPKVSLAPQNLLLSIPGVGQPRWASASAGFTPAILAVNLVCLLAAAAAVSIRWKRNFDASEAGRRAACRKSLRRRLRQLAGPPDDENRLLAAARWLEDWQQSPLARPMTESETDRIQEIRDNLAACRYAAALRPPVGSLVPLPDQLASLLHPPAKP